MTIKSGQTWAGTFNTLDSTGAVTAATGTPAGTLYVDGVSNGATVTITGSNPYKWSVTLPSLTAGQRVDLYITATIATIATAGFVASEQADTVRLSDGVTLASSQPAITWGQQKIVANVAHEGALDIVNTNLAGIGQRNYANNSSQNSIARGMVNSGYVNGQLNFSGIGSGLENGSSGGIGQSNNGGAGGVKNISTNNPAIYNEGSIGTYNKGTDTAGVQNEGTTIGEYNVSADGIGQLNAGDTQNVEGFDPAIATASNLQTVDDNVDSILADTGTDGVKIASAQTVATVTNLTNLPTMPTDWVTAAGLKADAVAEIQNGLATATALATAQADLDNPNQYKADVSGIPAAVWGYATRTLSSFGSLIADIWSHVTRTLSSFGFTVATNSDANVTAIKAKTDNLPANTATALAAIQADLDNPAQYKADVSGLATQASVNAIPTTPLLAANYVAPNNAGIADIKAKTDNLPASPAPANEYDAELAALQADLDNADQYKADVSGLATTIHVQEVENKVDLIDVTTVANSGKIDAVDTKVSAIDTDTVMSFMIDGFTFEQIVQIMASVLAGKLTRSGDTLTFKDLADTVNRVVAETDANKQRTTMTYTV